MVFLKKIYYLLIVINIIILILSSKELKKPYFIFLALLPLVLVTQILGDLSKEYHFNRYPIFHIYIPVEFGLLSIYYYQFFKHETKKKLVVVCSLFFGVSLPIGYLWHPHSFYDSSFIDFVLLALILIIYSISYFIEEIRFENEILYYQNPSFWINMGNLLFYTGCLFIMGFNNYLEHFYPSLSQKLIYINYSLNLLLYSFYIKGFLCILKAKKS
jgi:hypothetical protein